MDWAAATGVDAATGAPTFSSEAHRKIWLYRALADDRDSNGHGTHVVGSLLGSPLDAGDLTAVNYRRAAPHCTAVPAAFTVQHSRKLVSWMMLGKLPWSL